MDKHNISKNKVALYYDDKVRKVQKGQHAGNIYQDLVWEKQNSDGYESVKSYLRKLIIKHQISILVSGHHMVKRRMMILVKVPYLRMVDIAAHGYLL